MEAVICTYGMQEGEISNAHAIQIRQATSAIFYGVVLLPILNAWGFTMDIVVTSAMLPLLAASFMGTASYLCYYRALQRIGASRSMALNITYSAWAIFFSIFLLYTVPSTRELMCCVLIVGGSSIAGCKKEKLVQKV